MKLALKVALIFTIIGALNWGLIGLFDFNLVATIFGTGTVLERIIYTIVGICGLLCIGFFFDKE